MNSVDVMFFGEQLAERRIVSFLGSRAFREYKQVIVSIMARFFARIKHLADSCIHHLHGQEGSS